MEEMEWDIGAGVRGQGSGFSKNECLKGFAAEVVVELRQVVYGLRSKPLNPIIAVSVSPAEANLQLAGFCQSTVVWLRTEGFAF